MTSKRFQPVSCLSLKRRFGFTTLIALGALFQPQYGIAQIENVEVIGKAGGICHAIDLEGDLAFVGQGYGLFAFDLSNPSQPDLLSQMHLRDDVVDVIASGTLAYIVQPNDGIAVIDITTPTVPIVLGTHDTPGQASRIEVVGELAYVADGDAGIQVFDISDPSSPTLIGSLPTPGLCSDVAVEGNVACAADRTNGLLVVDLSDPTSPTTVGSYRITAIGQYPPMESWGVDLVGSTAYLTGFGSDFNFWIFDVSNPAAPAVTVSYFDTNIGGKRIHVEGSQVYISGVTPQAFDVSTPWLPQAVGPFGTIIPANDLYPSGTLVCTVGHGGVQQFDGLKTYSATTMSAWNLLGEYPMVERYDHVRVLGRYAYTSHFNYDGVQVLRIASPSAPTVIEGAGTQVKARRMEIAGGRLFVCEQERVGIYGLQFPTSPTLLGDLSRAVSDICLSQGLAYTVDVAMRTYDITDVTNPSFRGMIDISGYGFDVLVGNGRAYVAGESGGLQIIDATEPTTPVLFGSWPAPLLVSCVALNGNIAYVGDTETGLYTLDVSNPTSPTQIGHLDTLGDPAELIEADGLVYIADGEGGLKVIDVTDPANPVLHAQHPELGSVFGLDVAGDLVYAASDVGLWILRVPPLPTSRVSGWPRYR